MPAFEAFFLVLGAVIIGLTVPPLFGINGTPRVLITGGLSLAVVAWAMWDLCPRQS
jgi:hypothetical protein